MALVMFTFNSIGVMYNNNNYILVYCVIVAGMSLFKVLTWLAAPVAIVKSVISLIHLIAASLNIAALDAVQRDKPKSG